MQVKVPFSNINCTNEDKSVKSTASFAARSENSVKESQTESSEVQNLVNNILCEAKHGMRPVEMDPV